NASPPNARTPPATKKRTPPIIESWECPYVISKKNGNIAPLPTFSVLSPSACFDANIHVFECVWHIGGLLMKHAKGMSLRYGVFAFCS
ncbi:MAG: hypothetical protein UDD86_10305, partial [Sodaliphilus sp.]|nr:hypothetical protein [Sodaliphilus sp.]